MRFVLRMKKRLLSELCQDGRGCLGSESSSLILDEQALEDPWKEMRRISEGIWGPEHVESSP